LPLVASAAGRDQTGPMASPQPPVRDGSYDAVVVDATPADDGSCLVELTIVAGPHKGEVVTLRARGYAAQALDLLGVPATLTVSDGTPSVTFEP
jgi:hypothetical protein